MMPGQAASLSVKVTKQDSKHSNKHSQQQQKEQQKLTELQEECKAVQQELANQPIAPLKEKYVHDYLSAQYSLLMALVNVQQDIVDKKYSNTRLPAASPSPSPSPSPSLSSPESETIDAVPLKHGEQQVYEKLQQIVDMTTTFYQEINLYNAECTKAKALANIELNTELLNRTADLLNSDKAKPGYIGPTQGDVLSYEAYIASIEAKYQTSAGRQITGLAMVLAGLVLVVVGIYVALQSAGTGFYTGIGASALGIGLFCQGMRLTSDKAEGVLDKAKELTNEHRMDALCHIRRVN